MKTIYMEQDGTWVQDWDVESDGPEHPLDEPGGPWRDVPMTHRFGDVAKA
jgi:hypothetical protein